MCFNEVFNQSKIDSRMSKKSNWAAVMKKIYCCCQDVDYFPVTPRLQMICTSYNTVNGLSSFQIIKERIHSFFLSIYVVKLNAVDDLCDEVLMFSRVIAAVNSYIHSLR